MAACCLRFGGDIGRPAQVNWQHRRRGRSNRMGELDTTACQLACLYGGKLLLTGSLMSSSI
jgi:hypothetical protein